MNTNIEGIFGFKVGDKLYIANKEKMKIYELLTDCIKIHKKDISVHGHMYGLYGNGESPVEYSLKYLDKRYIFTQKDKAERWLANNNK